MKRRYFPAALPILLVGALFAPKPIISNPVSAQTEVPSSYDSDASWSPLGNRIAFISGRSGNLDIWIMEPDGTNPVNLTANNSGFDGDMSWSPDGKRLAFTSERNNSLNIWVMDMDSLNSVNLTENLEGEKGYPRWSPDGNHLAFVATRNGKYEVWVMDADGANPRKVSPASDLSFLAPSWLTNDQVVFLDRTHVSAQVWKITLDTEEIIRLDSCAPKFNVLNVEASHAANMIAFMNRNDGDIWVIDATDYSCRNLTEAWS